jgi:hypothetical protein
MVPPVPSFVWRSWQGTTLPGLTGRMVAAVATLEGAPVPELGARSHEKLDHQNDTGPGAQ